MQPSHGDTPVVRRGPAIVWRPPLLIDALLLAADVCGVPPKYFEPQERLEAVNDALEGAPPRQGAGRDPRRALAHRLATMAATILQSRCLPDRPRLAEALLRDTIRRSQATWAIDGLSATLALQAWSASEGGLKALADVICRDLESPRLYRPESVDWARRCRSQKRDVPFARDWIGDHESPVCLPGLYVAGPFAHLEDGSRPHVELVRDDVARGMELALAYLPLALPTRLLHPSSLLAENRPLSDPKWLALSREWIIGSDGLLLSDVAQCAPGFGAGVEAALYCSCSGPSLVILDSGCDGHSRFERGLAEDIRADIEPLRPGDELAAVVAQWFASRYETFLAAWRRRQNSNIIHARRHHEVCVLIARASDERLANASARSALSIPQMTALTESVEMMGVIPWMKLESLTRELRIRPRNARRTNQGNEIRVEALREAAALRDWSARQMAVLLREAQRELALTGAEHRLPLMTAEDWMALHERLSSAD